MTPSESAEQKRLRQQSERENLRATQEDLQQKTRTFARLNSPSVSLATGARSRALPLR